MARWDGIYEFVQVVNNASFSAAAEKMNMSNSQVSKLVARLEERLGIRLLNRTTRKLTLTDEGEHFYHRCKSTIINFEDAEQAIASHQSEPRGHLKVNISGDFQDRFIAPILADFLKTYPKVEATIDFTDLRADIIGGGYDLSICEGQLEDSSLVARKLADNYHYLVAHPDYLKQHGTPQSIDELKNHNCLTSSDNVWYLSDGGETVQIKVHGNWRSDNGAARLSAAQNGLGIALLPFFSVLDDIADKNLIQILEPWNKYPQPVWVMYPQHRYLSAKVRLFIDYLIKRLDDIIL
jgi:DNA-binding transcriptional LysR family regulator